MATNIILTASKYYDMCHDEEGNFLRDKCEYMIVGDGEYKEIKITLLQMIYDAISSMTLPEEVESFIRLGKGNTTKFKENHLGGDSTAYNRIVNYQTKTKKNGWLVTENGMNAIEYVIKISRVDDTDIEMIQRLCFNDSQLRKSEFKSDRVWIRLKGMRTVGTKQEVDEEKFEQFLRLLEPFTTSGRIKYKEMLDNMESELAHLYYLFSTNENVLSVEELARKQRINSMIMGDNTEGHDNKDEDTTAVTEYTDEEVVDEEELLDDEELVVDIKSLL